MSGIRRVTGLGLDGSTVSTTLGKLSVALMSATYGDKLEPGKLTAMGAQEIDEITPGNYSTDDAQIKMSAVEFRSKVMEAMPAQGGGNVRMPLIISRSHPDLGDDSDLLEDCRITNLAAAVENSNKAEEVTLNVTVRQIRWTYARKTINQLRGPDGSIALPAGTSGF